MTFIQISSENTKASNQTREINKMHSYLKEADELSMLSDDILQYVENMKRLHRKIYNQKIFCSILGHKINR